jgi:hypothetical protein
MSLRPFKRTTSLQAEEAKTRWIKPDLFLRPQTRLLPLIGQIAKSGIVCWNFCHIFRSLQSTGTHGFDPAWTIGTEIPDCGCTWGLETPQFRALCVPGAEEAISNSLGGVIYK